MTLYKNLFYAFCSFEICDYFNEWWSFKFSSSWLTFAFCGERWEMGMSFNLKHKYLLFPHLVIYNLHFNGPTFLFFRHTVTLWSFSLSQKIGICTSKYFLILLQTCHTKSFVLYNQTVYGRIIHNCFLPHERKDAESKWKIWLFFIITKTCCLPPWAVDCVFMIYGFKRLFQNCNAHLPMC